jgi:translation initiation factor 1
MSKKSKQDNNGFVFSTNPDFRFEEDQEAAVTLPPAQQKLRIRLDSRQRAGKSVTLIEGFSGKEEDLKELEKKLKNFCGTGGSAKDSVVIIQGDQRKKILQWLLQNGFTKSLSH